MTEPATKATGWMLYRHRHDASVLLLARPLEDETYECKRWGQEGSFVLEREAFLASYERKT